MRRYTGQVSLEFAVVFAVIVGALLAMQVYIKRGISGNLRSSADQIGDQYAPRQAVSDITTVEGGTTRSFSELKDVNGESVMISNTIIDSGDPQTITRTGNETIGPLPDSIWDK